mmetsp:Transcript_15994/g.36928  ORF Transcript_15994/g.36928 Transcript_15994/m.36928 type:complete len:215 (+) Transcript_15994:43-687(+)
MSRIRKREDIVGTPEYLSPEILLGQEHSFGVDWWALGIILFEFLYGLPPFTGDTPEKVFERILAAPIPWYLGDESEIELSAEAKDFISGLLTRDPKKRLGYRGCAEVKSHPFFAGVDWDTVMQSEPAFVPELEDAFDTSYFEPQVSRRPSLAAIIAAGISPNVDPMRVTSDTEHPKQEDAMHSEENMSEDDGNRFSSTQITGFDFMNPDFMPRP